MDDEIRPYSFLSEYSTLQDFLQTEIHRVFAIKYQMLGMDFAKGSGMVRGDIIRRDGNVTYARFRTVDD